VISKQKRNYIPDPSLHVVVVGWSRDGGDDWTQGGDEGFDRRWWWELGTNGLCVVVVRVGHEGGWRLSMVVDEAWARRARWTWDGFDRRYCGGGGGCLEKRRKSTVKFWEGKVVWNFEREGDEESVK